jgi:5-formyltetrahydrofolate cyclo-ligase
MGDKAALRSQMRRIRKALAASSGEQAAQALARRLSDLPVIGWSEVVVGGYHAAGSEIDPSPLMHAMAALGAQITLPVVTEREAPLAFRRFRPGEPLEPDLMGLLCPRATAPELRPLLVLVPLLAFDDHGGRLGQGGGYYDRTLQALRSSGPVLALGLAYGAQHVSRVPMDPFDQALDGVLTEEGYRAAFRC